MPTEYNTDCFVSFRFVGLFHVTADAQAGTTIHFRVDIGREEGKPTPMPAEWGRDSRLLIKDLNVELTDDASTKGRSDQLVAINSTDAGLTWSAPAVNITAVRFAVDNPNQITGEGSEWVRGPRLTLEGKERWMVTEIVESALANRPNL